MKMIAKPGILEKANTSFKLINLALSNCEKLLSNELITFPTATKNFLKSKDLPNNKKYAHLGKFANQCLWLSCRNFKKGAL